MMTNPSITTKSSPPFQPSRGLPAIFADQMQVQERKAYLQKEANINTFMHYISAAAATAGGIAFTALSALMQFSPQFALFVGMHVSPITIMIVAAIGVGLLALGLYHAHAARTPSPAFQPNQQERPRYGVKLFDSVATTLNTAVDYVTTCYLTPK